MEKNRIQQIEEDIAAYHEAIENAEGAIVEAERELYAELEKYVEKEPVDFPNE